MTQTVRTPGPWRIGDAGHTVFGPPNGNPSPQTIAHPPTKADARLIAAAPDLLAALEQIAYSDFSADIARAKARAAIAKATGETK